MSEPSMPRSEVAVPQSSATDGAGVRDLATPPAPETQLPRSRLPDPCGETDVWWSSYSAWTMLPSTLLCVVLTVLIVWGAWTLIDDRRRLQLAVWALTGAVWLVQGVRWAYRWFGFNYRLTNRRMFVSHGLLYGRGWEIDLTKIAQVDVQRNAFERLANLGRIQVRLEDTSQAPIVLEGVPKPLEAAELIRETSRKARASGKA